MNKIFKVGAIGATLSAILAPIYVFAQPGAPGGGGGGGGTSDVDLGFFDDLVSSVQGIVDLLIPLIVTLAVLFFFWGLAVFILNAGDEEARAKGRNIMVWGIIALFFIVAVWGIVRLLATIFGVDDAAGSVDVPTVGDAADSGGSIFN